MMDRIPLTDSLDISRIVYGMWRLGDDTDTRPAHVQAKIEAALSIGITTFDQADIYGDYGAEALLGACLKEAPDLRGKMEIVTKCGIVAPIGRHANARVKHYNTSAEHIQTSVETSLQAMAISEIDLLLIHRPDPFMDAEETGRALDGLIKSGKVRSVGVSNFRPHDMTLLQSAMTNTLVTNQIELSVLETDAFTNGDLAYLQTLSIPPMAWSPLGGGRLFGDAPAALKACLNRLAEEHGVNIAAIAVAWLLAHPARIAPVMGTNKLDRILTLQGAVDVQLSREDWFEIYEAARGMQVA